MTLRLGDLTFNADSRQILRGRTEVHVSPKAFELLRILLEERPRALSKHELHQRLWPSTFVTEGNLATLVGELREALGDSARKPRFIRTAHRFGYAFCGEAVGTAGHEAAGDVTRLCWLIKDGRRLPLSPGENVLGRDAEGGIHIDSVTVSRRHARIVVSATDAILEDLQSKNGTYVDGKPISKPTALNDGNEIRTGSVTFRFRMPSAKGSTATWTGPRE